MDKALKYKKILTDYLHSLTRDWTNNPSEEVQVVCDKEGRHFLVVYYGWSQQGHLHSTPIHLEIKDNKVWIQENLTEIEVDDDLVAQGIPKSDIVLGVLPPEYRKYSGFAVV
jgi:hypothetical protein